MSSKVCPDYDPSTVRQLSSQAFMMFSIVELYKTFKEDKKIMQASVCEIEEKATNNKLGIDLPFQIVNYPGNGQIEILHPIFEQLRSQPFTSYLFNMGRNSLELTYSSCFAKEHVKNVIYQIAKQHYPYNDHTTEKVKKFFAKLKQEKDITFQLGWISVLTGILGFMIGKMYF